MTESLKAAGWNEGENPILPNGKLQICRARLVVFSLKNQMAQLKLIDYHSLNKKNGWLVTTGALQFGLNLEYCFAWWRIPKDKNEKRAVLK